MITMYKKIQIDPSQDQKDYINYILEKLGIIWNLYKVKIDESLNKHEGIPNHSDFSYYLMNDLINEDGYGWLEDIPKNPRNNILRECFIAHKNFLKKIFIYPRYKSNKNPVHSFFFIGNGTNRTTYLRNINTMKIPYFKNMKILYQEYILPSDEPFIKSGRLIKEKEKYFISLHLEYPDTYINKINLTEKGLGIDMGIRNYLTIYDGNNILIIDNINKSNKIKYLEKRLKILQRRISKKLLLNKISKNLKYPTKECISNNICKLYKKLNKIYTKLKNIRIDFIKKTINYIIMHFKPKYITIETLGLQRMIETSFDNIKSNLAKCNFRYLTKILIDKCHLYNIELRMVNENFPSSKMCSNCGNINHELTLRDKVFNCKECGFSIDRDINAAINLYNAINYIIV